MPCVMREIINKIYKRKDEKRGKKNEQECGFT